MARGGYGRGAGIPLRDRVRVDDPQLPPEARATSSPAPAPTQGQPARHCWIAVPVDGGQRRPGLLLEWRHGQGWEGRVVYAAELRPGRWATVEEWLPAELLDSDTPAAGE